VLASRTFDDARGRPRRMAAKTLEEWLYRYRHGGFEALKPAPRADAGRSRVLAPPLQELIVDLKREDPGRSAPLIVRELELAGHLRRGQVGVSAVQRLLRRRGLSGHLLQRGRALTRPAPPRGTHQHRAIDQAHRQPLVRRARIAIEGFPVPRPEGKPGEIHTQGQRDSSSDRGDQREDAENRVWQAPKG